LRLPPTPGQLADQGNLHALVWTAQERLRELGVNAKALQHYRYDGFDPIARAHQRQGLAQYSAAVTAGLVDRSRALLEQGATRPSVWRKVRKCAAVLDELSRTGGLQRRLLPHWGLRNPGKAFDAALEGFCLEAARLGWGEGTVASARRAVRQLLFAIEDAGISIVSGITPGAVNDAVTAVAQRRHGGAASWLFAVRAFLRHLHNAGATRSDLSVSVPSPAAPRRVARVGFAAEEVHTLLAATAGDSTIQKRDRAIMTLAAQTGLRAGDLARLERSDIDWRTNEIRLVQAKTGRTLWLPLGVDSGNAIADYLLNYRTPGDSPSLFVCCTGPIRPLGPRTVSAVVTRYMRRCDLAGRVPRRGAHSFRRGLGTRLLEAEVSIDTLRQILGHMHINPARPYLRAFVDQKRALGYLYTGSIDILRQFDAMCSLEFPGRADLGQDICMAWAVKRLAEGRNALRNRTAAIREFARYLTRLGESAYLLPPALIRKGPRHVPHIYTPGEIAAIWQAADDTPPLPGYPIRHLVIPAIFRLIYCCGLRPVEARTLPVSAVDLGRGRIEIAESKGHKSRQVWMADDLTAYYRAFHTQACRLLPGRTVFFSDSHGAAYTRVWLDKTFRTVRARAGITPAGEPRSAAS
jgi:integrase/recombinase XerD